MDRIQNRVGSDFLYNQFKIQFFRRSRCFEDDNLNHFTKFNCESALRNLLYPWIYTLRLKTIFSQTSRFPTIAKLWISILLCSVEKVNNNYMARISLKEDDLNKTGKEHFIFYSVVGCFP